MVKNLKSKLVVASSVLSSLLLGSIALAAVDPDVASTTNLMTTTWKENLFGVIGNNILNLVYVGILIVGILLVYRLGKRFLSGR